MEALKYCRAVLVVLASVGVVMPGHLWADTSGQDGRTERAPAHSTQLVRDVALGPNGTLRGTVYDVTGHYVPRQAVVLTNTGRDLASAVSNDQGRFEFRGLCGGVYGLSVDGVSHVYRVWTSAAAPPASTAEVALVTGGLVQRGQRPFAELFVSDPIVLGVVLAAAIAIPIAVHNARSDRPAS